MSVRMASRSSVARRASPSASCSAEVALGADAEKNAERIWLNWSNTGSEIACEPAAIWPGVSTSVTSRRPTSARKSEKWMKSVTRRFWMLARYRPICSPSRTLANSDAVPGTLVSP